MTQISEFKLHFIQGGAKKVEHFIFIRYIVTSHTYAKLM